MNKQFSEKNNILIHFQNNSLFSPHYFSSNHTLCDDDSYRIYRKYSDSQTWANSVDPDQMQHSAASDQCLLCCYSSFCF